LYFELQLVDNKLVCPEFLALHAGEILLLSQAVHLALPGVKVAAYFIGVESNTIWNISWNSLDPSGSL